MKAQAVYQKMLGRGGYFAFLQNLPNISSVGLKKGKGSRAQVGWLDDWKNTVVKMNQNYYQ